MSVKKKLLILTHIPSPYQVELFNALAKSNSVSLKVAYLYSRSGSTIAKHWQNSNINHDCLILDDRTEQYEAICHEIQASDLIVFNYYQHDRINQLIDLCIKTQKKWCFWGERPGCKHDRFLGFLYRRWKLLKLHQFPVPIWGVGEWAVQQYRSEFGIRREYVNLPYFSDLDRFHTSLTKKTSSNQPFVFLYSGALIYRKGVDLLATVFNRLAAEFPHVQLKILGTGDLQPLLEQELSTYQERVEFLGFQPWHKLPTYYQQADVLCVPSRYDGWALVVPEGLASGLPVISTKKTGAAIDLIKHHQNGWLIPADDRSALYNAMKQAVMLSPQELYDYSRSAIDSVNQHSLQHGVERLERAVILTLSSV
jgi:glycosyltransferase involved in cell wall biosynthesis